MTLSVLHVSTQDGHGGSGRASYRIHQGLRALGVRSRMVVAWPKTGDPDVTRIAPERALRLADMIADKATERLSLQYLFYPSSSLLPFRKIAREADLIQLYNTHGGYFAHRVLPRLSRGGRPIVWRLSDMWPFTGHCAYAYECERWRTGCGSCPRLSDYPGLRKDRTALLFAAKARAYRRTNLTIVAPSRWIAAMAESSPLFEGRKVHVIPNGIDTDVFRPIPKDAARAALGLPAERPVVLFSAQDVQDPRKGAKHAEAALQRVATDRPDAIVLVVGQNAKTWRPMIPLDVVPLEFIADDRLLAIAYSAADAFLLPTLAENLPNGVLESLACGTPAVAFDVGGVADGIIHGKTGYLAPLGDARGLAEGILAILGDPTRASQMGADGRATILSRHTLALQAQRFLDIYQELLE